MDLLLPPREGSVSSIGIFILLASGTLGGTGATRLPAGIGPGQGGRCRGTWRGQRPSTGLEVTPVLSVPAVNLRPACPWRHLSGRGRAWPKGVGRDADTVKAR